MSSARCSRFSQCEFREHGRHDMKWLMHFASSQKNIDCVAKWGGGAIVVLALMLLFAISIVMVFR
jgi:hypothetical protein